MLMKRSVQQGEINNVQFIEGFVQFGNVKLNVICYEIDGVMIDTGAQILLQDFKPFFSHVNAVQVIITHFHEDHTGGAAYLQNEFGLPIYMNKMSIENCTKKASYPLYRKIFWGNRRPFQAMPLGDTFTSKNAEWAVISTPGHAMDHVAFLNKETGQLFSGDLFVHPKTKVVLREESVPTTIHSIEKVLTYDFDEMFCCHAGYVKDGKKALRHKLHHLQTLQHNILTLHQRGLSVKEIQQSIFTKKYPITLFSFGEWSTTHIITSVIEGI